MTSLPRSFRSVVPASLTLVFALQVLVVVFQGLFGEDLGPPERTRSTRKLHLVAVPEPWRSGLESGGRVPLMVFVDGSRLKPTGLVDSEPLDTPLRAALGSLVPPHFHYDHTSAQLIISCPDVLPCRKAVVVASEPSLAFALARHRLWQSPVRALGAAAILAACISLAFRVSRSATAAQLADGGAFFLCGLALWLSGARYATPFSIVLVASGAVGFSAPFLLQERFRRVPGFVADLLLFHDPVATPRPAWWRIAKVTTLGGVVLLALVSMDALAPPPWKALASDQHRNSSLEIALNRVLCGTNSRLSDSLHVAALLGANPDLGETALRDVVAGAAGSIDEYCRSVVRPIVSNESSLMLEMAIFAAARPQLSIRGLGLGLQASRILALLIVAYVLLECGASLLFATTLLVGGLTILGNLDDRYYSAYPFLPILLALVVAALCLSLHKELPTRAVAHGLVAVALGCLIAFAVNMRTSHLPVYGAFLGLYLLAAHRRTARRRPQWPGRSQAGWLAAGVAGAGFGYGLFWLLLIAPLQREMENGSARSSGGEVAHHHIAHPLVLGLALPESPLSVREGIQWDDMTGLALARRIDPQVDYLSGAYESALFRYYLRLWAQYPAEMRQIYLAKFRLAGKHMLSVLSDRPDLLAGGRFLQAVTLPIRWVPDGLTLLLLYTTAFGISTVALLRNGSTLAFALSLFAAAALLLQVECALIHPVFVVSHQASQLMCVLVLSAFAWQLLLEGRTAVRSATRWLLRPLAQE